MSKFINKAVTGFATVAMAVSMLVLPVATTAHAASAGEVYKSTDGTVWFITKDMNRRPFTSAGAFMSYGFLSFSQVKDADASVLALPVGSFIAPQDGRIFCATETKGSDVKGECSLITGGNKAAFTSASVFGGQGYSFDRAFYGDSSFLTKTSNVDNASAQHRNGTLINNGGTVQLVVAGGLWGVPSMDVFNSWGWSFSDVVPANSADKMLSQIGVIPARMAGDLVPTATTNPGPVAGNCGLKGDAGSITVANSTTDVDSQIKEGSSAKVQAFTVKADGSDVALKNVKVLLNNNAGNSSSTRLDRYVSSVDVYQGTTKVGSADAADFTKDGTDYTKNISLNCAVVRDGATKSTFYVVVHAIPNIDGTDLTEGWDMTVSNIRYEDAQGAIITDSYSNLKSNIDFVSLASSSDVKVSVAQATDNPTAGNVQISDTGSTSNVPLLKFNVKAEGSSMSFDQVDVLIDSGTANANVIISELQLKKGSQVLATADAPASTASTAVTFDLDNTYTVNAGSTDTFTVTATVVDADNFTAGDTVLATFQDFHGSLVDQNGDTFADGSVTGSAVGNTQAFYANGVSVTNFSAGTPVATTNTSGVITKQTYHVSFDVTAFGNTYYMPKGVKRGSLADNDTNGLAYLVETSAGATAATADVTSAASSITSSDATTVSNYFEIPEGTTRHFSVTIELTPTATTGVAGFYHIQLNQVLYDLDQTAVGTNEGILTLVPTQNFESVDSKID